MQAIVLALFSTVADFMANLPLDLSDDSVDTPMLRVEGKTLVVVSGTRLPPICVRTNQPVTNEDMVRKDFYWCSPWYAFLILVGVVVYLLVYILARQQCTLTFGLHPSVKAMYRKRIFIKSMVAIALFISLPFVAATNSTPLIVLVIAAFIGTIISFCIGNTPLTVTKAKYGRFWVKGFSPEYLEVISKFSG